MKKLLCLALVLALLLCGCGPKTEDLHPEWDKDWYRADNYLAAEAPTGFTLIGSRSLISDNSVYYGTWQAGEKHARGKNEVNYDAQLYFILRVGTDEADAEATVQEWIDKEVAAYVTGPLAEQTVDGQDWQILPLEENGKPDNPYSHGATAFAVRGRLSLCAELLLTDGYAGDAGQILNEFLSSLHYGD